MPLCSYAFGFLTHVSLTTSTPISVTTADPEKEPPLTTSNIILSILASKYPLEKLSFYPFDDGGAVLTFEALAEAASFAII